jgi:hypothetical protein
MNNKFKVNFIGIGSARCGTTAIAQLISEHPEISLFPLKEMQYFNKYSSNSNSSKYEKEGMEGYEKLFKKYHVDFTKKVGEFSVQYIYDKHAPSIIKKHFPNTKIIAIIRDPVERAFSEYKLMKNLRITMDSSYDLKYFKEEGFNFEKALKKYPQLIKNGKYGEQLNKYYELFPKKNIKIIIYEDFINNPKKIIKELYNFLEVNQEYVPRSLNKRIHASNKKIKSKKFNILFKTIEKSSIMMRKIRLGFIINNLNKIGMGKTLENYEKKQRKTIKKETMNEKTREILHAKYLKDMQNLSNLLNKNLTEKWKI